MMSKLTSTVIRLFTTNQTRAASAPAVRPQPTASHPQGKPRQSETGNARSAYGPDRIGIVGYHERSFVIARPAVPFAPWLLERSQELHNKLGGTTNITAGLRQSLALLEQVPPRVFRKIYLLSDGEPNVEVSGISEAAGACREARVNIVCIGFGDSYNEAMLRQIAAYTHHGRFVSVQNLRELTRVLLDNAPQGQHVSVHRSETAILAIDCSASMREAMEGRTKIEVVEEAVRHLIHYKQRLFS